jgi:hypothetical protein
MNRIDIATIAVIVVMLSLFSGCIAPDPPATVTPTPTPTPDPAPTYTPVFVAPTPTPTPAPTPCNDTNESIYDNRSAAWLYAHGYYGSGGGGGGSSRSPAPIPENATFYSVAIGVLGLHLLCRRSP